MGHTQDTKSNEWHAQLGDVSRMCREHACAILRSSCENTLKMESGLCIRHERMTEHFSDGNSLRNFSQVHFLKISNNRASLVCLPQAQD